MRSRLVKSLIPLVVGMLLCSGCDDTEKPKATPNPFAGQKVTVSVPAGLGLEQAWELSLPEWKQRTGAEAEVLPRASSESVGQQGDLVLLPITRIAEMADAGLLSVLSKQRRSGAGLDWNDLSKGLRETVGSNYSGAVVVPISSPVLVCYYREDLLSAAGLAPPRTWADYQRLLESTGEWAGGLPAVEPWCEEFRATMFLARAVSSVKHPDAYSVFFDITTGAPLIDSPGFVRALQTSTTALKAMSADVLKYDAQDCRREFFAGRAALAIAFETGIGNPPPALVPSRSRETHDAPVERPAGLRAGFCPLPGVSEVYLGNDQKWVPGSDNGVNQVTLTGFGGLCAAVSSASSKTSRAAAWNLFSFLISSDEFTRTFPPKTRSLCRTSQMSAPNIWLPQDITAAEGGGYLGEVSRSLQSEALVMELALIGREKFRQSLTEGLTAVLNDEKGPADGLKDIAKKWSEIAESLGVEKVRDSYRDGLGLRPLGTVE